MPARVVCRLCGSLMQSEKVACVRCGGRAPLVELAIADEVGVHDSGRGVAGPDEQRLDDWAWTLRHASIWLAVASGVRGDVVDAFIAAFGVFLASVSADPVIKRIWDVRG